jgi:hypothetical protein
MRYLSYIAASIRVKNVSLAKPNKRNVLGVHEDCGLSIATILLTMEVML